MTLYEACVALPGLLERRDFAAIENLSAQILKIQPHNPAALYFSGQAAEATGHRDRASRLYQEASRSFPHDTEFFDCVVRTTAAEPLRAFTAELQGHRSRIEGFPNKPALELVSNPAGQMFVPVFPDNDMIAAAIRSGRVFDEHIVQCASEYIRSGTTVVDVGANFGQMTLQFARLAGESGRVIAIEADDYVHHVLRQNLQVNGVENVTTVNKAAHVTPGLQVFFPDQDFVRFQSYGSYGLDPNARTGRSVETITVDSLNIEAPVSFMKVDVQGSDLFALQGAKQTILRHRMPIIFEYEEQFQAEFGTTFQDYVDFVLGVGYRFVKTVDDINFVIAPR
jgi:FkbM family methyltransferase